MPGDTVGLDVLLGHDRGDAGERERAARVDRDDARVRVGTPQESAMEPAGQPDVVQVVALAADEARVLLALEPPEADRPLLRRAGEALEHRHLSHPDSFRPRASLPTAPRRRCSCSPYTCRSTRRSPSESPGPWGSGSRRG